MCGYCKGNVQHERDTIGRVGKLREKVCVGKKNKRQDEEVMGNLAGVLCSLSAVWMGFKGRVAKKEQMPERAAMALTFPRAVMPLGRKWSFLWAWRRKHLNTHEHTNVTFTQPLLVRKMTILVSACWFILFLVVFKLTWIDWATAAW